MPATRAAGTRATRRRPAAAPALTLTTVLMSHDLSSVADYDNESIRTRKMKDAAVLAHIPVWIKAVRGPRATIPGTAKKLRAAWLKQLKHARAALAAVAPVTGEGGLGSKLRTFVDDNKRPAPVTGGGGVEAKLRALVVFHCDTGRYTAKRPILDAALVLLNVLLLASVVAMHYYCLFVLEAEMGSARWFGAYFLLWFVQQYAVWINFFMLHEWRHENCSSELTRFLFLATCFLEALVFPADVITYFLLGHVEHHKYNGHKGTSVLDFVREPWFPGKDADCLFFGFSLRNPFGSDAMPITPLVGPITYAIYSGPVLAAFFFPITLGTVLKFGWSSDAAVCLLLQLLRAVVMVLGFKFYFWHAAIYYIGFVPLTLHFSVLAWFVPLNHPPRMSPSGYRQDLERRYGEFYPTFTPDYPDWVHHFIFFGLTYHIEHHCFCHVPWYNLHLVNQDIVRVAGDTVKYPQPAAKKTAIPDRSISLPELAEHGRGADSYWIAVAGVVLDITKYHRTHPGGAAVLLARAGTDASAAYFRQHSTLANVRRSLPGAGGVVVIGRLAGAPFVVGSFDDA